MIKKIFPLLIILLGLFACVIEEVPLPEEEEYRAEVTFVNNSSYDLTITDEMEYNFDSITVPANETVVHRVTDYFYYMTLLFSSGDDTLMVGEHILVEWDDDTVTIYDLPFFDFTFVNNSSYDITIEDDSVSNTVFEDFVLAPGETETIRVTLSYIPSNVYLLEWEVTGNEMTTMSVDNETLTYTFTDS